ncbi:MAG TPA: LysM peptidoglycan-binding domain-containing protein, partial [Longimicrobium sp.]|nr:LysM peptidoglycan-binding domain-containing protein [Longimicrobium sp.]
GDPEPRDTITLVAEDTAPARPERPSRWSQPFAVEGSGEVAPRPAAREVVWLPADSVRARRLAARRDTAGEGQDELAAADSANAADDTDNDTEADSAPPPRRTGRSTASRDTAATGRRTGRTTRADTASTGRRSASRDDAGDDDAAAEAPRTTRRTPAGRDTAATTRRTTSRDTAATRRTTSRDTAGARRTASRDTASRRTTTRPRTHRVASGETLFGIARRYSVTTAQIRALNPDLGETLEIGTVLRLPAGARAPGQPAASRDDDEPRRPAASRDDDDDDRPAPTRPSARTRRHTVAAGETLYGIARRYGVTVDAVRRANRLEGDTVRPGQALVIPAAPPAQR